MRHRNTWVGRAAACLCAALLIGLPGAPAGAQERDRSLERMGLEAFEQGYRAGRADERRRGFSPGLAWNDRRQAEAYERLERAAAELRRALVLMRRTPPLPRVQGALLQAREALESTQNAMTWLPPRIGRGFERRYEHRSGRSIGAERASGGWAS
jgi:hypothetical protein